MRRAIRLLLIDDDPAMVRLLSQVIGRSFADRIELVEMTDGPSARLWIEEHMPDLVVTDLEMPTVDGLEILKCAKRRNPCAQVLMLTGHSSIEALFEALESGASDYLLKPVDQESLVMLLEQACSRVLRWKQALRGTMRLESQSLATL